MRVRRLLIILGPFVTILLIVAFYRSLTTDRPKPYSRGEKLSFARLAPDETITVTWVASHRGAVGREYHIARQGDIVRFTAFDILREGEYPPSPTGYHELRGTSILSQAEATRLDATTAYFRSHEPFGSSANISYRFEYARGGRPVGEELFLGPQPVDRLADLDQARRRGESVDDSSLNDIAAQAGLTRDQLDRLTTFRQLELAAVGEAAPSPPASVVLRRKP